MNPKNKLYCISYIYLGLPFVIFCLGWLRMPINIAAGVYFCWIILRKAKMEFRRNEESPVISRRQIIITILILGVWIFFSGIGGFTFQNRDFHIRNAIFRDLINYSWPVIYSPQQSNYIHPGSTQMMLVYYIGYWLPAALVGKWVGWGAANTLLFLWTWLGVSLVVMLLATWLKKPPLLPALILIFFSGMDVLGAILINKSGLISYPFWPPTLHLEWWAGAAEYSSFTTQLYWVFNQALPTWLCMALLINGVDRKSIFLLWGLCFFFAPLPALGMIPFVVGEIFREHASDPSDRRGYAQPKKTLGMVIWILWHQIITTITPDNLFGGGSILAISYLYFSTNIAAQKWFLLNDSLFFLLIFVALEGGLLWLILLPLYRKKLRWYIIGGILFLIPLVQVGDGSDFSMRVSIPALFLLMMGTVEGLFRARSIQRILILVCLLVGAVTPLYEINRSVYKTAKYYLSSEVIPQPVMDPAASPEFQPYLLIADNIKSISNCKMCLYFVGDSKSSIFYKYLAKR